MLLNTGKDCIMIIQCFDDQYQLCCIVGKVQSVFLAKSLTLEMAHEPTSFSVGRRELQVSFADPVKPGFNHNFIAGMNCIQHNRP